MKEGLRTSNIDPTHLRFIDLTEFFTTNREDPKMAELASLCERLLAVHAVRLDLEEVLDLLRDWEGCISQAVAEQHPQRWDSNPLAARLARTFQKQALIAYF